MPSRSSRSESGSEDEANRGLQTPSSTHHSSRNSPNISTTTTKGHHGDQQVRPIIGGENGSMPLRDPPRSGNNKDNNQKANRDVPPLRVRIGATNLRSASSTIESPDSPGKAASGSRQYETAKRIRARKSVWACDRCYRLKAKCDSGRPTCSSCTKGEFTCSYTARERGLGSGRGRRTITVKAYAQMLETRIKELEVEYYSRRAMARSESRGNKQIPSNPNSNGYLSNEMPNEIRARIPDPRGGIGIHDGFRFPAGGSRQNERNRYIPRGRPPLPPMPHRGRAQRSTEAVWPLFSTDVMNDMVRIYFDTISPQWLLQPGHRRTFTSKPLGRQPSFLVLCIAAQSAPYSEHPEVLAFTAERNIPPYRASAPYYYQARKLLGGCLLDNPSIETSWGLALLGIAAIRKYNHAKNVFPQKFRQTCGLGTARPGLGDNRSSFFFGMSIRMALGLNICIDPDIEEVHGSQAWLRKEAQRRLWWMLSSLDTLDIPHSLPQLISTSDRPTITAMPVLLGSHNGRTRIPAPDAMWEAVRKEDNLPAVGLFTHGHDLNIADASARLIRLHGKLQEFGLSISQTFHRALNAQPRWLAVGGRGTNTSNTGAGVRYPKHSNVSRNNSLSSSRHTIEKELQDWFHYLPLWARNIDHSDSFSYSPYSQNPPPWHLLNLHLIHHAIYIAVSIPIWLEAARPLSSEHDYRATPNDFHTADKSRPHGATSFPEPTASRTLNHRTLHHLAASVEAETSERSTPSSIEGKADMRRPRQHPLDPPTAGSQHFHPSILNSPQPHTTSTSYTTADCFSHDPELVQRYNYARRHCRWTSDKILLIRRLDPQLQQVSVLALYFTFYSALFIAFEVIYNEATSLKSPLGYASNPSLHELHQDLETHLSWFSAHGRRCHLGTHLYQLINKFLADHRCQYPNVYTS